MSTPRSTPDGSGGAPTAPRVGRRVGIVIFWLMAAWVVGMSSVSVISALYWPESAPRPAAASVDTCAKQISELDEELSSKATEYLGRHDIRGMEAWLQQWDRRYLALSGGCGPLEPARKDLGELRAEMERLLERYSQDAAKRHERIRQALHQWRREPRKPSKKELK